MDEQQLWTKSVILESTSTYVDQLQSKWLQMFNKEYCKELMYKLDERVLNFYKDLLIESDEKEKLINDDIRTLRDEAAEVTRLLHKNVDIGEKPDEMPLIIWQQTLDKSIEDLREELRERRAEICELLLQQEQLCEELGELPLPLLADPLPKPAEMLAFSEHLSRLQAERTRRIEELFELRSQIKQHMKVLELVPLSAEDERLLCQTNQFLTPNILEKLRFMKEEFAAQVVELHERIDDMRGKINVLWERLQESNEKIIRKVRDAKEYTQSTFDILHEELQRCQELRRQNLKGFIEQLRLEIKKWWDLTLKSEQERKRFSHFYCEWYSEDLLELHELELDDLKSFYNDNKEIFDLFNSRAETWTRMVALEAKAKEPNRFNNRGGQLLKEERERKAIATKLPKIEQQITKLVKAYEDKSRSPFFVYGENILEHMANDWERLRQSKEQQSSARKQTVVSSSTSGKMLPPATPGVSDPRTPMSQRNISSMSSSTMSLRRTPSNRQLTSMTGSAAKTTGNLHKRKLPNAENKNEASNAKRNLLSTLSSMQASPSLRNPSQRVLTAQQKSIKSPLKKVRVLESTLRRSGGLGRRSVGHSAKKPHTKVTVPKICVRAPSGEESDSYSTDEHLRDDTYSTFEKSIEPAARSSLLPITVGRRALPKQRL